MPRILYLTTPGEDYLQDQMLYGLRMNLGEDCVDSPRKDLMYRSCQRPDSELYGRGFTLWKLLPDVQIDHGLGADPKHAGDFDAVVFGSIRRQKKLFRTWVRDGKAGRHTVLVFLDGEDRGRVYKPALPHGGYYKRERKLRTAPFTRPISFSIPRVKLVPEIPVAKTSSFARHVQCEEAYGHPAIRENCQPSYVFEDEAEYRGDLQHSYFGITMKKAGWDCMRHYEIAANGAVPCFYRLRQKSRFCAPFDLVDGENCVSFESAEELREKTDALLSTGQYPQVAAGALSWARDHTCEVTAQRLLADLGLLADPGWGPARSC